MDNVKLRAYCGYVAEDSTTKWQYGFSIEKEKITSPELPVVDITLHGQPQMFQLGETYQLTFEKEVN